ncbi:MAG: AbrB/MazE/SpoVT family DNA-binding domain-containing protein [Ignisphaera sp.]
MYADVVRVDSKGRITIPSTLRLLLNIEEGDQLVLLFDESTQKIEILGPGTDNPVVCITANPLENVLDIISNIGNDLIAVTCRRIDEERGEYKCKIVLNKKALELGKAKGLKCL